MNSQYQLDQVDSQLTLDAPIGILIQMTTS
jgi:hypothetical protein